MLVCPACRHENREGAKFCDECGATLVGGPVERRAVVSVLFCDVVGSTALGESSDAETVRGLLARYFERMSGIVVSHGGSVEKFIGDAVVAVFGVPVVHEDDALRACRAAVEMRDAFAGLGVEGRIGVCTGEVVTGTKERLATGDALNVAARLQGAAAPGEVLIAETTFGLAGGTVDVEPVEPLVLKGKAEPVAAFRLLAAGRLAERRHEALFVGREHELAVLSDAWRLAIAEQRCVLVTVVGEAGIGKSRLVAEAVDSIGARVVRGRCLPYGAGITYWPVVEVVKQLDAMPSDPAAAAAIRSLLGESEAGTSADEIGWAFRKLLEEQSPLVVVFDDIQWGEPTFVDLVEQVTQRSRGAPLLVLCMARPELLDQRPSWPVTVRLEPLGGEDATLLVGEGVSPEHRSRIVAAAAGNPLFIGEMLAMTREAGADVAVPPTLQALLAARLDQLEPAERHVLERAAVEGEVFHRGAVQSLAPEEPHVEPLLEALVRRRLIHPATAQFTGEEAFRFHHLLLRDTAYGALWKATRAQLHERFAAWLDERDEELVEHDEILGFHLEHAARYKQELGQPDPVLAERAGERLAAAGVGALSRHDMQAAEHLLERALALIRPTRLDVPLELRYARALSYRDMAEAVVVAEAAAESAHGAGDSAGELHARLAAASHRVAFDADPRTDELEQLALRALSVSEQTGDREGLARVWSVLFQVAARRGLYGEAARAAEQSLRYGGAGAPSGLAYALVHGPRPADEALRTVDSHLPEHPQPWPVLCRALLLAMLERFDEATATAHEAAARADDLFGDNRAQCMLGELAVIMGDHERAATHLRRYCDTAEAKNRRGVLASYAPMLGRSLCKLGRYESAEPLAQLGRKIAAAADAEAQALWRQVQALVDSSRGHHAQAEKLAREAVAAIERTDSLGGPADALVDLAEVLHAAGRTGEAEAVLSQALERYERKHDRARATQTRRRLAGLVGTAAH